MDNPSSVIKSGCYGRALDAFGNPQKRKSIVSLTIKQLLGFFFNSRMFIQIKNIRNDLIYFLICRQE